MTGAMIATAVLFFPAAPAFLLIKGKDVVIVRGTPVTSCVDGDTLLEEAKFEAAAKPAPGEAATPAPQAPAPGPANKPAEKPATSAPPKS